MKISNGERIFSIMLFIFILFLIFSTQTFAFDPQTVDVTTKQFSIVWCNSTPYTSCSIELFSGASCSDPIDLEADQIIIETEPGNPGAAGKAYGLGKITVTGLEFNTEYCFRLYVNGVMEYSDTVTTQNLRGLDPNSVSPDIANNIIIHKAVYKSDGGSPALGALVLAEVYSDSNINGEPTQLLSNYPVSAWVGENMIKNTVSSQYDPNDPNTISYQQYAPLNLNNVYDTQRYLLNIEGDDPDTSGDDSEYIKFTVLYGKQTIVGFITGRDNFVTYGRVGKVDHIGNEKISSPKICTIGKCKSTVNTFSIPFSAEPMTGLEFYRKIEKLGGTINKILLYKNGDWKEIRVLGGGAVYINPNEPIGPGDGGFILMNTTAPADREFSMSGSPTPVTLKIRNGLNMFVIPQCPVGYKTENLFRDVNSLQDVTVTKVYSYDNGWRSTTKVGTIILGGGYLLTSEIPCFLQATVYPSNRIVEWSPISP